MPDDDIIPKRVPRRWIASGRSLVGGASPPELAPSLARALSATLRDAGGCPGLPELGATLKSCAVNPEVWDEQSRAVVQAHAQHPHTVIAAEIAGALLETQSDVLTQASENEVTQRVAEEFVCSLIRRYLFSRLRNELVRERFANWKEEQAFEHEAIAHVPVADLARRLLARPDGVRLVAPSAASKQSTAELLYKPIVAG